MFQNQNDTWITLCSGVCVCGWTLLAAVLATIFLLLYSKWTSQYNASEVFTLYSETSNMSYTFIYKYNNCVDVRLRARLSNTHTQKAEQRGNFFYVVYTKLWKNYQIFYFTKSMFCFRSYSSLSFFLPTWFAQSVAVTSWLLCARPVEDIFCTSHILLTVFLSGSTKIK